MTSKLFSAPLSEPLPERPSSGIIALPLKEPVDVVILSPQRIQPYGHYVQPARKGTAGTTYECRDYDGTGVCELCVLAEPRGKVAPADVSYALMASALPVGWPNLEAWDLTPALLPLRHDGMEMLIKVMAEKDPVGTVLTITRTMPVRKNVYSITANAKRIAMDAVTLADSIPDPEEAVGKLVNSWPSPGTDQWLKRLSRK